MAEDINIGGRLHSVATGNVVAGANEIQDDALNKKQSEINSDVKTTIIEHESIIQGLNSQNYESYSANEETTSIDTVLPDLGVVNTIYRLGNWDGNQYNTTQYAEYAWINTGVDQGEYVLLNVKNYGIDAEPTAGSKNLVESGGIKNELALGAVYDVSVKNPTAGLNNDGRFESLTALLSDANINTLIPVTVRKGGMSIKFVQSSDNKYIQFRYISNSTTFSDFVNVDNWQEDITNFVRANSSDYNVQLYAENSLVNRDGTIVSASGHNIYKISGNIISKRRQFIIDTYEGGAGFYLINIYNSSDERIGVVGFVGLDGVMIRGKNKVLVDLPYWDSASYILVNNEGNTPTFNIFVSKYNNLSQKSALLEDYQTFKSEVPNRLEFTKAKQSDYLITIEFENSSINSKGEIVSNQYTTGWYVKKISGTVVQRHSQLIIDSIFISGNNIGVICIYNNSGVLVDVPIKMQQTYNIEGFILNNQNRVIVDLRKYDNVGYILFCEESSSVSKDIYILNYAASSQSVKKEVLVDKNGKGDFTKVSDAVKYANFYGNTTVYINPGVYDIIEELGGLSYTENLPAGGEYFGMQAGYNNKYVGLGEGVKLTALYSGSHQPMTDNFSIFNAVGSFEIHNIAMEVENVRYCVHDDMPSSYVDNYTIKYKNCKLKHNGTISTTYTGVEPIGGGCRGNSFYEVDGCIISNPTKVWGISYHNNSYSNQKARVKITNTYFVDCTFMIYCYQQNGSEIEFEVSNNSMNAQINRQGLDPNNKCTLISFNNEIRS